MREYDIVIGLEVHSELKTKTKCFCSCPNEFGSDPNANTCPTCLALPGALPVPNRTAVEYCVRAGLATNCEINPVSVFERKNYFYPDLSKAYQISQLEKPLCEHGYLDITVGKQSKRIRINRIHLEEDAGKLIHDDLGGGSLVDYNRGGVPLIEIVSEPDISSADEAVEYLQTLRNVLIYTGVTDGKMQEGSLRCDVNVSVKPKGSQKLGTRTEMKNLNSFRAAHRAILFEAARQISILEEGGTIAQETRRWDDGLNKSFSLRSKEDSQDYRYFPDPDLIAVELTNNDIEEIRKTIPMLPAQRREYYVKQLGLPEYDAQQLVEQRAISNFFEEVLKEINKPKLISNWIMTDVMRKLKENESDDLEILIDTQNFVQLLKLVNAATISVTAARTVFDRVWNTGEKVDAVVEKLGLKQVSNEEEILQMCKTLIAANPQSVQDFKAGNERASTYLIGQVMKTSGGKYNPQVVRKLIMQLLSE